VIPSYCDQCGTELGERRVEGRDRKWCPECERLVFRNAVPCAGVAVVDGDRVLLVERAVPPGEGDWTIPGGHLEVEEEPRVGAARELEEETGVRAPPEALTLLEATQLETVSDKHVVSMAYAVDVADTTGSPVAGSDAAAVEWVRHDKVTARPHRSHAPRRATAAVREFGE
jgi:ADP-ribose pyrophosphatase YjhB (NUDIX family)